ncbi:Regulatory protein BlaR1 [Bremerella volcania]|uniref:Regulatory protein BlaR1 n=1 Tax=Bremerella volcania TaxID=2527984 RepID=A0A518CFF1_9BACT|nr:M56 family metallopeptidase [Bremerella volcania]QDU77959.1 Regulatory protein BlaR1 [Bremerella volcania]
MIEVLTDVIEYWSAAMWRASWHGAIAVSIAWLIDSRWQSMPATWRSWLWRLVFLKIVLALLPITLPIPVLPGPVPHVETQSLSVEHVNVVPSLEASRATPEAHFPNLQLMLFFTWIAGIGVCALSMHQDARNVRRRLEASRLTVGTAVVQHVQVIMKRLHLVSKPQIRVYDGSGSPCLVKRGNQPVVLLPARWLERCSSTELQLALAHELAHFIRKDLAWNRFVACCRSLFFFHPLVWVATQRYLAAQEIACDKMALSHSEGAPADYARLLVQLAEQPVVSLGGAAAMIGSISNLRERIAAMYRSHHSPPRAIAWALMCVGVLSLVPFSLAQQVEKPNQDQEMADNAVEKSKLGKRASASASASGGASGFGFGAGAGAGAGEGGRGNGRGLGAAASMSRSQSRAAVSVSLGEDDDENMPEMKGDRPNRDALPRNARMRPTRMKQTMMSGGPDASQSWKRTTEATLEGNEIKIVESDKEVSVSIKKRDGSEQVFVASTLNELAAKSPEAADLYKRLVKDSRTPARSPLSSSNSSLGKFPDARALMREQIESMKNDASGDAQLQGILNELDQLLD